VLEVPLAVDLLDAPLGVLGDRAGALMGAEARVVMGGVVGEMRGDAVDVARVQRLVIGADVVEVFQSP
jgi:hypothetical protein